MPAILLLVSSQLWAVTAAAAEPSFWDKFKDPADGRFDIIGNKDVTSGLLPVVVPFNEPAVGLGVVGALAYFHPQAQPDSSVGEATAAGPPSTTFGGGLYSENKTWAVAGGHLGVWDGGRTRYLGAVVYGSVNLDFYGIGRNPDRNGDPIPFNIEGGGTLQQFERQLGDSRFFAGARYEFSTTYGTFNTEDEVDDEGRNQNAGLGLYTSYDSRDNIFTPNTGTKATVSLARFVPALGGDFTYNRLDLRLNQFWRLHPRLIFGLRLEYRKAGQDAPFYALPWVRLRGVPAFRYLGYHVVMSEVEPRWNLDERWSVLAFAGAGRAASSFDRLREAERAYNYGGGVRYLVARRLGLAVGLDLARGPEDTTGYLTIGSAW